MVNTPVNLSHDKDNTPERGGCERTQTGMKVCDTLWQRMK